MRHVTCVFVHTSIGVLHKAWGLPPLPLSLFRSTIHIPEECHSSTAVTLSDRLLNRWRLDRTITTLRIKALRVNPLWPYIKSCVLITFRQNSHLICYLISCHFVIIMLRFISVAAYSVVNLPPTLASESLQVSLHN